jgi:hypothetical protein
MHAMPDRVCHADFELDATLPKPHQRSYWFFAGQNLAE